MSSLKIAIVHHHLRGGGVTRIIQRTLEALKDHEVDICVLSGEEPVKKEMFDDQIVGIVKGLSYGKANPEITTIELYDSLKKKAKELLDGDPDIWHIHNHTLG